MTEYKLTGGSAQVNQTEGGYYGRIVFDQSNDQTIYCTDTNATVSTDGGKTFKPTGWDAGSMKTHVDHRGLWVDPAERQPYPERQRRRRGRDLGRRQALEPEGDDQRPAVL